MKAGEDLLSSYQQELTLKRNIQENICHSQDKRELMFMLACWSHEPFLDENVLLKIDAMTTETGHGSASWSGLLDWVEQNPIGIV